MQIMEIISTASHWLPEVTSELISEAATRSISD